MLSVAKIEDENAPAGKTIFVLLLLFLSRQCCYYIFIVSRCLHIIFATLFVCNKGSCQKNVEGKN